MEQITVNELSEVIKQLFKDIQRNNKPLTVTDQGEPLVVISPATSQPQRAHEGALKDSGEILGDLIAPAVSIDTWEVLQ